MIRSYDKPTADQIVGWIAESLGRARRASMWDNDRAVAEMILRDLRAKGVRMVVRSPDDEG